MPRKVVRLLTAAILLCIPSLVSAATPTEQWRTDAILNKQRAAYQPVKLPESSAPRAVVDLAGDWLFKPSQELDPSARPADPASGDKSWYVFGVPQFWAPVDWASFRYYGQGSYAYQVKEKLRCARLGFDGKSTKSGWYRQWFEVPKSWQGKRLFLRFTGVACVSQVYWNGKSAGGHVGMFGPFECEVTPHVRFGERNLLAMFVSSGKVDKETAGQSAAVAVTVDVTRNMLNSLPKGLYLSGPLGGIWQPASLIVSGKDRVSDVYFRPTLDGATIETTIDAKSTNSLSIRQVIIDKQTGAVLYRDAKAKQVPRKSMTSTITSAISGLKPKLWSPEHPNLYVLKTQLISNGKISDEVHTTVGFRTFEVKGKRLYLNGKPYFLRGANDPPQGVAPTDRALANKFMKLMHDGNEMVTRFHGGPFGDFWLDAADNEGIGVSMQGEWPWVLIGGNAIPSKDLLDAWKHDQLECVRAYRNHPSILMWTINNENYFTHGSDSDAARKAAKYGIFSDMVKGTRALSPHTPVVFFSGYRRGVEDYDKIVKPRGFDDGDIDDKHNYYAWYDRSPSFLKVPEHMENDPDLWNRPLISQETAIPYSDVDTGRCLLAYQKKGSAWVGQYAYNNQRPDMFLQMEAQLAKEYAEKIRRDKTRMAGVFLFCNMLWFKDSYDADAITPFPVYWEVKKAWAPVLISLENANRHFFPGQKFWSPVQILNDDPNRPLLHDLTLEWSIHGNSVDCATTGAVNLPDCRYDNKVRQAVEFEIPSKLPDPRSEMVLELTLLQDRKIISRNTYPLICANQEWCSIGTSALKLTVLETDTATSNYLKSIGCDCDGKTSIDWASASGCVVVAPGITKAQMGSPEAFAEFLRRGGRALILEPTAAQNSSPADSALGAIPSLPMEQFKVVQVWGDFVDVWSDDLIDGLDPMDMHWLNSINGDPVRACRVGYQFPDGIAGVTKLAQYVGPHAYIKDTELPRYISWPIFEVKRGSGRAIVSSIVLSDDPIAKRLLANTLRCLNK